MDGAVYMLPDNDNGNCLHGGCGFDYRVWTVESAKENSITLSYYSPDGEEGFPSGLAVAVTYTLEGATLMISYKAIPDGKTPVALTNHAYFNLDGFGGTVKEQTIQIYADRYTAEERATFEKYIAGQLQKIEMPGKDEAYLRTKILEMYANPALNQLSVKNEK